jgi:hypothetical protein
VIRYAQVYKYYGRREIFCSVRQHGPACSSITACFLLTTQLKLKYIYIYIYKIIIYILIIITIIVLIIKLINRIVHHDNKLHNSSAAAVPTYYYGTYIIKTRCYWKNLFLLLFPGSWTEQNRIWTATDVYFPLRFDIEKLCTVMCFAHGAFFQSAYFSRFY